MDSLKNAVAKAFDNVVASGAIEAAIEKQLAETIVSAIRDQFSNYGDFSKAIKTKINSLVEIDLNAIDIPSYRDLVGKIIQNRVGAVMTEQFTTLLDKDICELLAPAPAEITLEKLLEDFVQHRLEYRDELRGQQFTLFIVRDQSRTLSKYVDVYLSQDADVSQYQCDFQLRIKDDGEVWALKVGGGADVKNQIFLGPMYNFEKRLFQMYTAKTKLIILADATTDDFETTYPDSRDD